MNLNRLALLVLMTTATLITGYIGLSRMVNTPFPMPPAPAHAAGQPLP